VSEPTQALHQDDRDHKTIMQQIGAWNLANTLKANMAMVSKGTGEASMPFVGKYVDNSQRTSGIPAAALGALLTAGGLGAYLWSQQEDTVPPVSPPAATTTEPIIVEGVIDWEFDRDAGFNVAP